MDEWDTTMNAHDLPADVAAAIPGAGHLQFGALRAKVDRLIGDLPAVASDHSLAWNWGRFELLLPRIDMTLDEMKQALEGSARSAPAFDTASQRQKLFAAYRSVASLCEEHLRALACRSGCADVRSLRAMAFCLHFVGESFKHLASAPCQWPYAALHSIWKLAVASGHASEAMSMPIDGEDRSCPLDRLYLRALALAWAARQGLDTDQLRIFDGWIWHWMPSTGTGAPMDASGIRSDPGASFGLSGRPTAEGDVQASVSRRGLNAAVAFVIGELKAGRVVPGGAHGEVDELQEQRATLAALLSASREA
jgi:hypothetical protein